MCDNINVIVGLGHLLNPISTENWRERESESEIDREQERTREMARTRERQSHFSRGTRKHGSIHTHTCILYTHTKISNTFMHKDTDYIC